MFAQPLTPNLPPMSVPAPNPQRNVSGGKGGGNAGVPGGGGMMKGGGRPMQPRAFDNNMLSAPLGSYSPSTTTTQAPNTNVEIPAHVKQQYGGAPSSALGMMAQALGQPQIQPQTLTLPSGGPNVQQPIPPEVAVPGFASPAPMPPQPMVVPPPSPQTPIPRPIMPRGMPPGLMSRLQRFGGF